MQANKNVACKILMINRYIYSSGIRIMTRATLSHQHIFTLANPTFTSVQLGIDKFKVSPPTAENNKFYANIYI